MNILQIKRNFPHIFGGYANFFLKRFKTPFTKISGPQNISGSTVAAVQGMAEAVLLTLLIHTGQTRETDNRTYAWSSGSQPLYLLFLPGLPSAPLWNVCHTTSFECCRSSSGQ